MTRLVRSVRGLSLSLLLGGLGSLGSGGCAVEDHASTPLAEADDHDADDHGGDDHGGDEEPAPLYDCPLDYELLGEVDGLFASQGDYTVGMKLREHTEAEQPLHELQTAMMAEMGLDPEDPEDQDRFRYLALGYDLRNTYTEYDPDAFIGIIRAMSITVYDVAENEVQPDTPIAIFDASALEEVRSDPDPAALGDMLRALADEMRSNGRPDAIVAFAPDRRGEPAGEMLMDVMYSANARFATSGTISFGDLRGHDGGVIEELEAPLVGIVRAAIDVDGELAGNPVSVSAECLPVTVIRD